MGYHNKSNIRPFGEGKFDIRGRVLPYGEYRPFSFLPELRMNDEVAPHIIERAEAALNEPIPMLPLSLYRDFELTGMRSNFETPWRVRRNQLAHCTLAESYERGGRFIDKIADLIFAILEESTWVWPAHTNTPWAPYRDAVPDVYREDQCHGLDLCGGSTAATLALTRLLLKDELDKISPVICKRIDRQIYLRATKPFLTHKFGWTGEYGGGCNNWVTNITLNVLFATAVCERDLTVRESTVMRAMRYLDNFAAYYPTDGSCDEGPDYWIASPGDYVDALELIDEMTGGAVKVYDHPHVRKMLEYISAMNIDDTYFVNFSDAAPRISLNGKAVMEYAERCGSPELYSFGKMMAAKMSPARYYLTDTVVRSFKTHVTPEVHEAEPVLAKRAVWFGDNKIAVLRECEDTSRGFFLATKGGTNGEAHNHLDVGALVLYYGGRPVFVDPSRGSYNNAYFGSERYNRWYTKSSYHSVPTVNGIEEGVGVAYASKDEIFDADNRTVTMELGGAFPTEAGIISMKRTCSIAGGEARITDTVKAHKESDIRFNYLTVDEPRIVKDGVLAIAEGRSFIYNTDLTLEIEKVTNTYLPFEDLDIERLWQRPCLWRIVLKKRAAEAEARITVK